MSTIKVKEELLCAMTFGEDCMVIRGNSTRDKKLKNFPFKFRHFSYFTGV